MDGRICIFSIDPGLTTGLCLMAVDGSKFTDMESLPAACDELKIWEVKTGRRAHKAALWLYDEWMGAGEPYTGPGWQHALVSEDFALDPNRVLKGRETLLPVEINAVLAAVLDICGNMVPLDLQPAGQAHAYGNNERLKAWGLWQRGAEHGRMAARHAALRLARYRQGAAGTAVTAPKPPRRRTKG